MRRYAIAVLFLLPGLTAAAQSAYPGQHHGHMPLFAECPVRAYAFDLADVRLLDSPFKQNMERTSAWLISLPVDRLLHSFRTSAGIYAGNEGGYFTVKKLGGWESLDCELRGHTTGHILSALSYLYASTGEQRYKAKSDSLVQGLAQVQEALKTHGGNGFLAAWPENLIDRNIAGQRVWAPWYTLHKLFAGLIDQFLYCGNEQALDIATDMAGWAYGKLSPLTDQQRRLMLRNEFGGVGEAFWNLYAITGEEQHEWLARYFYHNDVIDPLAEGKNELAGKHANTFIPKVTAQARCCELTGDKRSEKIATYFWDEVVSTQTYCTGGNSTKEKFIAPGKISENLTGYTQESCNTNNMLKLTRHLFCWSGEAKYADYYERALYNHILGQQDPSSGMVAYFLPLAPGAHKVYSTPENSFWCCVGTGFENHSKYGEAIWYHTSDELMLNLFIPSVLTWKERNVTVKLETAFPQEETVRLTIGTEETGPPHEFTLQLRHPEWAQGVEVRVNGRKWAVKTSAQGYIPVKRRWADGDRVEVRYKMALRLAAANDDPAKAAVMYGPLVLAGTLGSEGMAPPAPFSDPALYNDYYTYDYRIPQGLSTTLEIGAGGLQQALRQVDGKPLEFSTADGQTLKPLYSIHRQRYVVYWDLKR